MARGIFGILEQASRHFSPQMTSPRWEMPSLTLGRCLKYLYDEMLGHLDVNRGEKSLQDTNRKVFFTEIREKEKKLEGIGWLLSNIHQTLTETILTGKGDILINLWAEGLLLNIKGGDIFNFVGKDLVNACLTLLGWFQEI